MTTPDDLVFWHDTPTNDNRLCVVISDMHCTDGTVGNQSGEDPAWHIFFEEIETAACLDDDTGQYVDEVVLVLNGDIVDFIRSSAWVANGVYPWQHDHPRFTELLDGIMEGIVRMHTRQAGMNGHDGFFYHLQHLRTHLKQAKVKLTLIPIFGNHDKELLLVPSVRRRFYEDCLGIPLNQIDANYRNWISAMYGPLPDVPGVSTVPWLPFYFGDTGFRLFVTHGQWRDAVNARQNRHWRICNGWRPRNWRSQEYKPFTDGCFGDTVAASLMSGFIWRAKRTLEAHLSEPSLGRILEEMDLYRPTSAAIVRILEQSRKVAKQGRTNVSRDIFSIFRLSVKDWLRQKITWCSAPWYYLPGLVALWLLSHIRADWLSIQAMKIMAWAQSPENRICTRKLRTLPGFHPAYRAYGFRIHTEGHTHFALEAELQFSQPPQQQNYTYINTGAWRDQVVTKQNGGYRRRGIGRGLFIFDLAHPAPGSERVYRYFVSDTLSWSDQMDGF